MSHGGAEARGHAHGPARLFGRALVLTLAFAGVEAVAGVWSGSLALLSDAGHMATDSASLLLALLAAWAAERRPTHRYTYGLGRAEVVAAVVNGLLMVGIVAFIVGEAIRRFGAPRPVDGGIAMVVAGLGLLVNVVVARTLVHGEKTLNTRAALLHVLGDLLGSVAALASGAIVVATGWTPADPLLSLVICGLILFSAVGILREGVHILLEGVPYGVATEEVGRAMAGVEGVVAVHDLHIWQVGSSRVALSAHVVLYDPGAWEAVLGRVRALLRERFGVDHATLQPERPPAPVQVQRGSASGISGISGISGASGPRLLTILALLAPLGLAGAGEAADPPAGSPAGPPCRVPVVLRVTAAEGGAPLPGARVEVEVLGAPVFERPREVVADADGVARVEVPCWGGPVRVRASAAGCLPESREVAAGEAVSLPLRALWDRFPVQVRFVGPDGDEVPVGALPPGAVLHGRAWGTDPRPGRFLPWETDPRGAVANGILLPRGRNDLALAVAGRGLAWATFEAPGSETVRVPVPPPSASPMRGVVVDDSSGLPIPRAMVRWTGRHAGAVETGEDGEFEVPAFPEDGAPDDVSFDWQRPGFLRSRGMEPYIEIGDPEGAPPATGGIWRLGMHRTIPVVLRVRGPDGAPVRDGFAWTLGAPWPTSRWAFEGGGVLVQVPADLPLDGIRVGFASDDGFAWADAAEVAGRAERVEVSLRPWRRIAVRVHAPGEGTGGAAQAGLHLAGPGAGALLPASLPPWWWTVGLGADGSLVASVPAGPEAILQVDVGRRTAFYRAAEVATQTGGTLLLPADHQHDLRTVVLTEGSAREGVAGEPAAGAPVAGALLRLVWRAPALDPRPLDLAYDATTDATGRARWFGPVGPYEVLLLVEGSPPRRLAEGLRFLPGRAETVRAP